MVDGVRFLFDVLPRQSALRKPLVRVLLDHLSLDDVCDLQLALKAETVKRYRSEAVDLGPLLIKRRNVDSVCNKAFADRRGAAENWIVNECGITQSGRLREVLKTELGFNALFRRYCSEAQGAEHVSVNVFARLVKDHHVHFGVGAVDTMTCVVCRDLGSQLEETEVNLLVEMPDRRRSQLLSQRDAVQKKLHDHQEALVRQRRAWSSDLADIRNDTTLCLCVLDFSTFELMDRKTTSVCCVVVIDYFGGETRRRYFDLVDVHLSGRKRDVVFFAMTLLYQRNVFANGQHVRLWADAGAGDFRNAPCLYSCLQLNSVCRGITFEAFNFFGARHGWNDCDRHFGTGKQALNRWLVEEASRNKELTLDVTKCAEILASLHNTTVLVVSKNKIAGADHPPIKGLTKHYCFRFANSTTAYVSMFSDEKSGTPVVFGKGQMLDPTDAQMRAKKRKTAGKK